MVVAPGDSSRSGSAYVFERSAGWGEQAKLTVCQSNSSNVGKTFMLYLPDLNKIPLFQTSNNSWCSWSFGGWSGTNRDHWEGIAGGVFNIETADRPLSVYALKGGTIARALLNLCAARSVGASTYSCSAGVS